MITVCSFTSTDEINLGGASARPLRGAAAETTYNALKAVVLNAGRFSVFEATQNMRAAVLFERLCKDPELEVVELGFPWTGIRRKES